MGYLFHLNATEGGNMNLQNAAADVMNHWVACNIYTTTQRMVRQKLEKLQNTYNNLKKVPHKKKGATFSTNLKDYFQLCEGLFDVKCVDGNRLSKQETLWKVKETEVERKFYDGQRKIPRV